MSGRTQRPSRIKVLLVDEPGRRRRKLSQTVRRSDSALAVTLSGPRGVADAVRNTAPHVLLVDLECTDDVLPFLRKLRSDYPHLPTIVVGATGPGRTAPSMSALVAGAVDFVPRPSTIGSSAWNDELAERVCVSVRRATGVSSSHLRTLERESPTPRVARRARRSAIEVVTVAVSTGGPRALATIFRALSSEPLVPIVVAQHMPEAFTRQLATSLDQVCDMPVFEVADGQRCEPGAIYIGRGDHHVTLQRTDDGLTLMLDKRPRVHSVRPAADLLFASANDVCGAATLALVLTGMGYDGLEGCRELRAAGATIVVQDEETSVVWGMAGAIAKSELAHQILALDDIASYLQTRARWRGLSRSTPLP